MQNVKAKKLCFTIETSNHFIDNNRKFVLWKETFSAEFISKLYVKYIKLKKNTTSLYYEKMLQVYRYTPMQYIPS